MSMELETVVPLELGPGLAPHSVPDPALDSPLVSAFLSTAHV